MNLCWRWNQTLINRFVQLNLIFLIFVYWLSFDRFEDWNYCIYLSNYLFSYYQYCIFLQLISKWTFLDWTKFQISIEYISIPVVVDRYCSIWSKILNRSHSSNDYSIFSSSVSHWNYLSYNYFNDFVEEFLWIANEILQGAPAELEQNITVYHVIAISQIDSNHYW
jgi:hypothetical protein